MARSIRVAAIAAFAVFVLTAPGAHAASSALIEAAKHEGRVTWYTTLLLDEASGPLATAFEKKYPEIDVDVTRREGTQNLNLILSEAKAGSPHADVFDGTTTAAFLMQAGLTEPYKADTAIDVPAEYKDPNGHWTAQVLYFQTIGYNADMVPPADVPKSYEDLLDPRWKDKLLWSADDQLTGAIGFIVNVLATMGEQRGTQYLEKLKDQNITAITSLNGVTLALAARRFPIGITVDNHHTVIANEKGAHVNWLKFEPLLGLSNNIGLVKNAPHPNAAKLLIDYILSVEGQTVLRNGNHIPSNTKVEAADPSLKQGFRVNYISPEKGVEYTQTGLAIYNRLFR
jgi:ABC-type Fe3+ transport system substrate-binding protein